MGRPFLCSKMADNLAETATSAVTKKPGGRISFPPILPTQQWVIRSDSDPPGTEYYRRTRLNTHFKANESFSAEFCDELQQMPGPKLWAEFEKDMMIKSDSRPHAKGRPPPSGSAPAINKLAIQPFGPGVQPQKFKARHALYHTTHGPMPSDAYVDKSKTTDFEKWF